MQSKNYWLSATARRGISFGIITCLGLSIFSAGTAEASRLVFTNEGDGNAPIDQDLDGDDNYELIFGDNLAGKIEYDQSANTFNIGSDTTVGGNLAATGGLDVQGGDITLQNDETISNAVDGTVSVNAANTTVSGAFDVQGGDITLQNDETISNSTDGQIDLNATTTTTSGALNVGTNLEVTGTSDLQGAVSNTTGDLNLNDNVDISGNVEIVGTTDQQGDISNSTGDVTINDALDVTGDIDAREDIVNSTGDVNVDDNLNVTGTTSLDGNTTVETGASFTVTDGTSTFGGALDVNSTSDFGGDITLSADSQIINLRAQNAATGGAICADATDAGRIFYDTTIDKLFYCAETTPGSGTYGFVSTDSGTPGVTSDTFYAEWENFSMYQDGTDNVGTIRSQYDNTDDRSYYYMTSRRATAQDLDLVLQWRVPDNFTGFTTGANHLQFDIETVGAGAKVDLRDVQVNGADQSISDLVNRSVRVSPAETVAVDRLTS